MNEGACTKKFPKEFINETNPNVDGYAQYKRENTGITYKVGQHMVGNEWVVPYNPFLLLKYNCHINIEVCASIKSVKYLYKYIYKGHDCANVRLEVLTWDEPAQFDSRYISAPEGIWRIRKNKMDDTSHTIKRLAVHLENMQQVYFENGDEAGGLKDAEGKNSTLQLTLS